MSMSAGALGLMSGWETSTRDFDGLTIDAPKAFLDRSTLVLRSPDAQGGFRLNIVITRGRTEEDVEAVAQHLRDTIERNGPEGLVLGDLRPFTIKNAAGQALEFKHAEPIGLEGALVSMTRMHVIAERNGTTFHIIATHLSDWFDANRSQVEGMLKSVGLPG